MSPPCGPWHVITTSRATVGKLRIVKLGVKTPKKQRTRGNKVIVIIKHLILQTLKSLQPGEKDAVLRDRYQDLVDSVDFRQKPRNCFRRVFINSFQIQRLYYRVVHRVTNYKHGDILI